MKLNEISGKSVWGIIGDEEYSAQELYGLYSSKTAADNILKIIKSKWSEDHLKERNPRVVKFELDLKTIDDYPFSILDGAA